MCCASSRRVYRPKVTSSLWHFYCTIRICRFAPGKSLVQLLRLSSLFTLPIQMSNCKCPELRLQMGTLERQLLWATIDASRRRSQRAQRPGKLSVWIADAHSCCLQLIRQSGSTMRLYQARFTLPAGGSGSLQTLRGGSTDGSRDGLASFLSESGTPDWVSEFRCPMLTLTSCS